MAEGAGEGGVREAGEGGGSELSTITIIVAVCREVLLAPVLVPYRINHTQLHSRYS